jgi:hypothetical protein
VLENLKASWRELAFAAVLAGLLPLSLLLSYWAAAIIAGLVAGLLFGARGWLRRLPSGYRLRRQLRYRAAHAGLPAVAAQLLTMFPALDYGVPPVVLAIAVGAAAVVAGQGVRLRGAPLPMAGEAAGRVAFSGRLHGLSRPRRPPGIDDEVALWVASLGPRRHWSSTDRVEVRDAQGRKAWIDPGSARPAREAGNAPGGYGRTAWALGGPDDAAVQVWTFKEGDPVYVIGAVRWVPDPPEPWYRGPRRAGLFTGDLWLGRGWLRRERAQVRLRLQIWLALALCAGAFALAATLWSVGTAGRLPG